MRPTSALTRAEWQRLARAALAEYDRVCAELADVDQRVKNDRPKFQGMTELA
jgi:hypothetical protein